MYVQQIEWTISLGLTIISISLFYLRLFPNVWLRNTVYGVGVLTIAWLVAITVAVVFQCNPIQFFWNHEIVGGKCIHTNRFYFAAGVTSTVAIIFVLFLPLPIILRLKTTDTKKFGLAASFILGAFVGVVSIIRLVSLFYIKRDDLTCKLILASTNLELTLCLQTRPPCLSSGRASKSPSASSPRVSLHSHHSSSSSLANPTDVCANSPTPTILVSRTGQARPVPRISVAWIRVKGAIVWN